MTTDTLSRAPHEARYDELSPAFFAARIRLGIRAVLLQHAGFAVFDLYLWSPVLPWLLACKAVSVAVMLVVLRQVRRPGQSNAQLQRWAMLWLSVVSLSVAPQGILMNDSLTTPMVLAALSLAIALLLPWGTLPQAINVAVSLLAVLLTQYFTPERPDQNDLYVSIGAVTAFIGSLYLAAEFDRTRRRRSATESALRESEARLALTLEATNQGAWDWRIQSGELWIDPRWTAYLGYTPEDGPAQSFWAGAIHEEDFPKLVEALTQHFNDQTPLLDCEIRVRSRSGEWRHVLNRGKVVERSTDGTPLRMLGANTDITDLKRQEERIAAILEVTRTISGHLDRDAILQLVQHQSARLLSCERVVTFTLDTARQVFRQASQFGVPPELHADAAALEFATDTSIAAKMRAGEVLVFDSRTPQDYIPQAILEHFGITTVLAVPLHVRGRTLGAVVALSTQPGRLFDSGETRLLVGITQQLAVALETIELYESQRADAEVGGTLAHIGPLLLSSFSTPAVLDRLCQLTAEALQADTSHTYLYDPKDDTYQAASRYGDSREAWESLQLLRIPARIATNLIERLEREGVVQTVLNQAQQNLIPSSLAQPYGIIAVMFIPLWQQGKVFGVLAAGRRESHGIFNERQERIARGIGQLASMALENARLFEELEAANRFRGEFLATMSHELRTPLNVIIGYNSMLLDGAFGTLSQEQTVGLRRADDSARQLLDLVTATLQLSRLDTPVALKAERVMLGNLIAELERETAARRPGVQLSWSYDADVAPLLTDRLKLKMVLTNLVSNALKFTSQGEVRVEVSRQGNGVDFRVTDTGIGIAADAQATIFEPFYQTDQTKHAEYGGVGLGLYIVRRLVEALRGSVQVESQLGRGSVFRVWIPNDIEAEPGPDQGLRA